MLKVHNPSMRIDRDYSCESHLFMQTEHWAYAAKRLQAAQALLIGIVNDVSY